MAALHLRPRRTLPALSMPDDDDALFSSDMPPTSPLPRRGSANSLSVREAQLGQSERRRLRGLHTTSFLQPRRSGRAQVEEEAQAKTVPKLWLLVLLLLFAGLGFLTIGQPESVAVIGRRSARAVGRTWDSSRSWTVDQLGFFRRWPYGLQLYDLYSAVRRGQWPSVSPGAPRRRPGRRVVLREVGSGGYVRVMTRREVSARRVSTGWPGAWDGVAEAMEGELLVGGTVPWLHGGSFEIYDASGPNAPAGTDQARWELLSRAEDAQGFVTVGWRAVFFERIGAALGPNTTFDWWKLNRTWDEFGLHWSQQTGMGWWVGGLGATERRSGPSTALQVELLAPADSPGHDADAPPRGVRGRELARVRLRAAGMPGKPGPDDWMGGGRAVVVDPASGALRLEGYAGSDDTLPPAVFAVEEVEPLRGVNLGAWLIPERDFTNLTSLSLCDFSAHAVPPLHNLPGSAMPAAGPSAADAAMEAHLAGWFTPAHFDWMVLRGVNAVRLPLGWWDVLHPSQLPDPGVGKAWARMAPGPGPGMAAIKRVLDWAAERRMSVLLDLHGGPGGQNGKDHSGCAGEAQWHLFSVNNSLAVVRALVAAFGQHEALWGIELLNEPGDLVTAPTEDAMRPALLHYYRQAYAIIRAARPDVVVVFCVLYWFDFWAWAAELREPAFSNVVLDVHMYTAFDGFTAATEDAKVVQAAQGFGCRLLQHQAHHPMLVGEWALAVDPTGQKVTQPFVDAQMRSFASGLGSYFWTLQMDAGAEMAERGLNGVKIGPSPQWDFSKAIDATPNTQPDGTPSPYTFPDLARHFPGVPGAPTLAQLLAEPTTGRPPRQPAPPPPIRALPVAAEDDGWPACPYVSPTGVALLSGALFTSIAVCAMGCAHAVRRRRQYLLRHQVRAHKQAMAARNPLASPLI